MRRRTEGEVPDDLLHFDPGRWPSFGAWVAAREAFHAAHGWPGGRFGWEAAKVAAAAQTPDERWTPPVEDRRVLPDG